MEAEEIDGLATPAQQVDIWRDDPMFYLTYKGDTAQAGMHLIQFNMNETAHPIVGGFSDRATKVRKALAHATEVDFIIDKIFFGHVIKGTSPFPSNIWGHKNVAESDPREYDIDLANKMLDEAGYPIKEDGWRFELYIPYYVGTTQQISEYLREQWKKVNVKVTLEGMDRPTWLGKWGRGEFDVTFTGPYHGPDASVTTGRFYLSTNIRYFPYTNCQQYNNTIIDELFLKAQTTIGLEKRQDYYDEIQETVWADTPTIWIGAKVIYNTYNIKFQGEPIQPFGRDDPLETMWWTGGSSYTPMGAKEVIDTAEAKIDKLASQMYKVGSAREKIADAKTAYAAGDWAEAVALADEAVTLPKPPIEIYGAFVGVIIIVIGGVIWYRRREQP